MINCFKSNKIINILFSIFLSTIINLKSFADEAYVYCANENMQWHWLDVSPVKGKWQVNSDTYLIDFKYFIIEDGYIEFLSLQNRCEEKFGKEFRYAQPSVGQIQYWWPFALDKKLILPGIVTYMHKSL